ncbi:MAG TPA: VCBS repeat-containing protein, partial [Kofleriaceae bacterium]|nr:VCBS repeat-containing protein [Kofleriaceae bacterium]
MARASLLTASAVLVAVAAPAEAAPLWTDVTDQTIGATGEWSNKVELADLDGDGRVDILFANGGNYNQPGTPEPNRIFLNQGPGEPFREATEEILGPTGDLARVIKARDVSGDGIVDIVVGTTYQTQSRLYLGTGGGAFREVTDSNLPCTG